MRYRQARNAEQIIQKHSADFGFVDNHGRALGFEYVIEMVGAVEATEGQSWNTELTRPGIWFRVWGAPTRNGHPYGPSFNYRFLPTELEAREYASKRLADCHKRYAKKFPQ